MSLWTPDGERPIPPASDSRAGSDAQPDEPTLTPEQEEQARAMAHELAEARVRLLETPASTVVVNHALGIYELAAIHLTADEPDLSEARLALDALAALVEGLSGRLGEAESTLVDALHHARLAFVQQAQGQQAATAAQAGSDEAAPAHEPSAEEPSADGEPATGDTDDE
jgi:hypothetical protein